jgi:hypothetical protein
MFKQNKIYYLKLKILFFLLISSLANEAQNLSTVFIDTLKIIVDNTVIYENNETALKFISNNIDNDLLVYNDGKYKLKLKFAYHPEGQVFTHTASEFYFSINDSVLPLLNKGETSFADCEETLLEKIGLQNWKNKEAVPLNKTQIILAYRYSIIAPIDTSNYKYNYKEGMWIGTYLDSKLFLNYRKDQKNGLAKITFKNGVSYSTMFNNNIDVNYGLGKYEYPVVAAWPSESYSSSNFFLSCNSPSFIRRDEFYFSRDKKLKKIKHYDDISLYFQKKGIIHDSIQYQVRGGLLAIIKDTIVVKSDEIEIHDFYKTKTDSLHDYYKNTQMGLFKVPINDIYTVYKTRSNWSTITRRTALISLATALIISPLISIGKTGFNSERFRAVSLTSLGVMTLSISFGIGFSQRKYMLLSSKKNDKLWKIKYD